MSGSSHGTGHFWVQRLTSVALIPLALWFCFSVASLPQMTHEQLTAWLHSPLNATLMILVITVGMYHGKLGLQVIIEDYVSNLNRRSLLIAAVTLISGLFAALGVVSVLKISLGA
jgi:succinate dehydrogenase / fumarate reductase membrane anchor subunit